LNSAVVSADQMRAAEEAAFARGLTAESLMDEAAAGIARAIAKFFPRPGRCLVFAGKGNNAGDSFAAASLLRAQGWKIDLRLAFSESDMGELARKKLQAFHAGGTAAVPSSPGAFLHTIVLDGLLGLGARPPLREPITSACREINRLRCEENAYVFAIDLPTGLGDDKGKTDDNCVRADCTITIGFAKQGLLVDEAVNFVGRLEVVALRDLRSDEIPIIPGAAAAHLATASVRQFLPRREFNAYKNQFGRVGVVAGSKGFTGAALLCSLGALRAGAGLVELFVPEDIYPIVAAAAAAEVMVKPVSSYGHLLDQPIDVWAVGPGLGRDRATEILAFIEHASRPMVVDADGLNILSQNMAALPRSAGPRLLTPHPGEMKRLFPSQTGSRAEVAQSFCHEYPVTLLLKGSRTIVAEKARPLSYNTTGNPGMATGGMGDVLTGVCAALIAQKLAPYEAARLGAWLCGRAAEIAIFSGAASQESLLPSDLLDHLGAAFQDPWEAG